jgi:hypothetical protein
MSTFKVTINFGPLQGRKRASTRILLGERYEDVVTAPLEPPQPIQDLSQYTPERVIEALLYADTVLRDPKKPRKAFN